MSSTSLLLCLTVSCAIHVTCTVHTERPWIKAHQKHPIFYCMLCFPPKEKRITEQMCKRGETHCLVFSWRLVWLGQTLYRAAYSFLFFMLRSLHNFSSRRPQFIWGSWQTPTGAELTERLAGNLSYFLHVSVLAEKSSGLFVCSQSQHSTTAAVMHIVAST